MLQLISLGTYVNKNRSDSISDQVAANALSTLSSTSTQELYDLF